MIKSSSSPQLSEIEAAQALVQAASAVQRGGCSLSQTCDFEEVVSELLASSKGRINSESSPYDNDIGSETASYIVARGNDGSLQGFASVRILDIGDEKLIGHLRRQFRRVYGNGAEAIYPDQAAPPTYVIQGRTGFISDIFIEKSSRGPTRLQPMSLMMAAVAVLALRWRPEWVYGFAKDRDVKRGLAGRYLTTRLYPRAVTWVNEPENRKNSDWLLCLSREDYAHCLKSYLAEAAPQKIDA